MIHEGVRSDCCDAGCYLQQLGWQTRTNNSKMTPVLVQVKVDKQTCSACGAWAIRYADVIARSIDTSRIITS